jgi:2Fe-2S ferredoxin
MYTVSFRFEEKEFEPITLTGVKPGNSILEIALMNDIELHHNCGGVCSCTTCHVQIEKGMEHIEEMSKREVDYIKRAEGPKANSRLGCQSILLEGEGEIEVTVPNQSILPDEYFFE